MIDRIEQEIHNLKNLRICYELSLLDMQLAKCLEKYCAVAIHLLKDWGCFSTKNGAFNLNPKG